MYRSRRRRRHRRRDYHVWRRFALARCAKSAAAWAQLTTSESCLMPDTHAPGHRQQYPSLMQVWRSRKLVSGHLDTYAVQGPAQKTSHRKILLQAVRGARAGAARSRCIAALKQLHYRAQQLLGRRRAVRSGRRVQHRPPERGSDAAAAMGNPTALRLWGATWPEHNLT